jgi:hypothetical protein
MKWENITLETYQSIYNIITSKLPDWEKEMQMVCVLFNLTEKQLDDLSLDYYRGLVKQIQFLYQPIPGSSKRILYGKKYRYKLITDVRRMPFARYAEVKTFTGATEADFIKDLHRLTASIVQPQKKICGIWVNVAYEAARHSEYADDLLSAPFIQVHASAVFFYLLFTYSIKTLHSYMVQQMKEQQMNSPEMQYTHLLNTLDGFIQQHSLPSLKASHLKRLGIFPPFKPSMDSPI